jgi:hypothetical protein
VNCHEPGHDEMLTEWIRDDEKNVQELEVALARARAGAGGPSGERAARTALAEKIYRFMFKAKGTHNTGFPSDNNIRAKKLLEAGGQP